MKTIRHLVVCAAIGVFGIGSFAQDSDSNIKEPAIPVELASQGPAYHTLTGRETQVVFTSDASLENIVGKCNQVVGYLVAGPDDRPAALRGARWILPVATMATGIPLRDDHMIGSEWLDAEHYPTIEFQLKKVEDIEMVKSGEGFSTWSVTLIGTLTLHGQAKEIRVEKATVSFLDESDRTKPIAPGDLVFLKMSYTVKMSDFGIKHHDVPDKVADEIELSQIIRMSTVIPAEQNETQH